MDQDNPKPLRQGWMGRWFRIVAGSTLVGLGIIGLFLPLLQGVLFIVIGLSLLSTESERARRLHQWVRSYWRELRTHREKGDSVHGVR